MLLGEKQVKSAGLGTARPWGADVPVPVGVPRRGKGADAPQGRRVFSPPHSSKGGGKEGGHLFPGCLPPQTLPGPVIQKPIDALQFRIADPGER